MMQRESAMRAVALVIGMLVVAFLQVFLGFLMWRNAVMNMSGTPEEAIYLPWIAATVAYGVLFWRSGYLASKRRTRWIVTIAIALLAGFISFLCMLTICANKFGT